MYDFDFSPLVWTFGAFIGGAVGLVLDLAVWVFVPLGWWAFAVPIVLVVVCGEVLLRRVR